MLGLGSMIPLITVDAKRKFSIGKYAFNFIIRLTNGN
jgi:hypothetical protein